MMEPELDLSKLCGHNLPGSEAWIPSTSTPKNSRTGTRKVDLKERGGYGAPLILCGRVSRSENPNSASESTFGKITG